MESDRLDALLQDFQSKANVQDPQQLLLLEEVRRHTVGLHQARGDWDRLTSARSWNADTLPAKETPPLELASYKNYVAKKRRQDASRIKHQGLPPPERIRACEALPAPPLH